MKNFFKKNIMKTDNHLIKLNPQNGYNKIFDVGECGMRLTSFGLLRLSAGQSYEALTGEFEFAFVLMGGKCSFVGGGFSFDEVGARKNPFDGAPSTVYLPRRTSYKITAITDVEIAVNAAPATRDTARPTHIAPSQTRSFSLGRDNFTRTATVILDEKFDSEHFYIGEGMIPSGNWSGYPPHRHDVDNLPEEIDMEETYFYLFNPPQGFGIQKIYTPDGRIDETYTVKNYDTVAIPEGYHPLCGAPGYAMYYLWTMSGMVNRGLISSMDPAHKWVVGK